MEAKPTLMTLRRELNLEAKRVADAAGVPLRVEYQMEIGAPVERGHAASIMDAISRLSKKTFTINDVTYVEKRGAIEVSRFTLFGERG